MNGKSYRIGAAGVCLALLLSACGGQEAATPAVAPTATAEAVATPAAATTETNAAAAAQESPLANPDSPLAQPASPLLPADAASGQAPAATTAAAVPAGPRIEIAVPSDLAVITQLAADTKAPAPKEGMAALSGVLYSPYLNRIIPGTQYYFTPAIEDNGELYIPSMFIGPQEDKGDVAGITNEKGQILIDNVPPGNYYLAVWTIYNWPLAYGKQGDPLPLLITVAAGEQRDLGLLYVEWP